MARGLGRSVALFAIVAMTACWPPQQQDVSGWAEALDEAHDVHLGRTLSSRVVLMTIDGARWQEVFDGTDPILSPKRRQPAAELMPNLHRLARERGALVGAPGRGEIAATGPAFVSLPGYTEILTGRSPLECQDNDCAPVTRPTVLDEAYAAGASVAAFASWERVERAVSAAPRRFAVSCGRDGDLAIRPYPGHGDYRPDAITASLALRHLEQARPDVLFLSLGDTDEYAHRGDYEGYLRALRFADEVLGRIFVILDRMGAGVDRTSVFVTADHGRALGFRDHGAQAPESARVWLFAAGPAIAARDAVSSAAPRRLADVAPTVRTVLGIRTRDAAASGSVLAELFEPSDRP